MRCSARSGPSSAAGIRTGWQVTQDLVHRVVLAEGVPTAELGEAPERWWISQGRINQTRPANTTLARDLDLS